MPHHLARRLAAAVEAWLAEIEAELTEQQAHTLDTCMTSPHGDVEVAMRLRSGVIELRGIDKRIGRHAVLYRQYVAHKRSDITASRMRRKLSADAKHAARAGAAFDHASS
jgi:hypothetical protein